MAEFEIKGKTLIKYHSENDGTVAIVPPGITKIGEYAFSGNDKVTDIVLPEGVELFEEGTLATQALRGCSNLERLVIPNTIANMPASIIEDLDATKIKYNEYENGLYLGNDSNPYVVLVRVINKNIDCFAVPDGCRVICGYAFYECSKLGEITIPETIIRIEEPYPIGKKDGSKLYFRDNLKMNKPVNYLKQSEKLPSSFTYNLVIKKWIDDITTEDCVWLFLYQGSKKLDAVCLPRIEADLNNAISEMLVALRKYPKKASFKKASEFVISKKEFVDSDMLSELYNEAVKAKAKNTAAFLEEFVNGETGYTTIPKMDPFEEKCRKKYKEEFIEQTLKKATISTKKAFKKSPVFYKNGGEKVPEYVVSTVLALYMEPMIIKNQPKIIPAADKLAEQFDRNTFHEFLRIVGERVFNKFTEKDYYFGIYGVQKFDLMIPMLCRLMNDNTVESCIKQYHINEEYISNYNDRDYKEKKQNIDAYNNLLIDGIIMSDSKTAFEFCKRKGILDRYAVFRGKAASELSGDDASREEMSQDELKISKAITVYDDYLKKMDTLMDGYYNHPTVMRCFGIGPISKANSLAEAFFKRLFNRYNNMDSEAGYFYDYAYKPYELYELWKNNDTISEGQVGLCFTMGLIVAYYMFESSNIEAEIVYCRDKWEYRGDYSYATRAALHITPDLDSWTVYEQEGYPVRKQ